MPPAIDITGEVFGMLTAMECLGSSREKIRWLCQCDCGSTSVVSTGKLRSGWTTSCGCKRRERRPLEERFWEKVDRNGPIPEWRPELGPCWTWTGFITPDGYGRFMTRGELTLGVRSTVIPRYAHQVAYEFVCGGTPPGLQLDHLCRTAHCVNPSHLEPVTGSENLRRSPIAGRKTGVDVCSRGHHLDDENVYVRPGLPMNRQCKSCERIRGAKYRARERAARTG